MKSSFLSLSSHDLSSTDSDGLDNLSKRLTFSMALVVLMCLAIWGAIMSAFCGRLYLQAYDCCLYKECAESLVAGKGLMHRPLTGLDQPAWVPFRTWAPGLPLLMASFLSIGFSAYTAGIIVVLFFGGIFVLILSSLCLQLFPPVVALPVALAGIVMPTFLMHCGLGQSDVPYTTLTAGSLICLINWSKHKSGSLGWVFAAGLLAGASYLTRYVGLSLLASSTLIVLSMSHRPGRDWRSILVWTAGVCLCVVPMSVHNLLSAQNILPYSWPANKEPFWEILRHMGITLVYELIPTRFTGSFVNKYNAFLFLMLSIPATWFILRRLSLMQLKNLLTRNTPIAILLFYACFYMAAIVYAHWKYYFSEGIRAKYMVPVSWILWIALASLLMEVSRAFGLRSVARQVILVCIFTVIIFSQGRASFATLRRLPPKPCYSLNNWLGEGAGTRLTEIPDDQIVLSDRPDVLRFLCSVNARAILPRGFHDTVLRPPTRAEMHRAVRNGSLWGVVIVDKESALKGELGDWIQELVEKPDRFPEMKQVLASNKVLIFQCDNHR